VLPTTQDVINYVNKRDFSVLTRTPPFSLRGNFLSRQNFVPRYQKLSFAYADTATRLIVTMALYSLSDQNIILPKPIAKFEYPTQMSTVLPPLEVPALS
jgi:hypothetical protein